MGLFFCNFVVNNKVNVLESKMKCLPILYIPVKTGYLLHLQSIKIVLFLVCQVILSVVVSSCKEEPEPDPIAPDHFENVVLVYSAGANNLYSNLVADKAEMLKGLEQTDPMKSRLMLYESSPDNSVYGRSAALYEAVKDYKAGNFYFRLIKNYPNDVFTTDPIRLKEVIEDVRKIRKADRYGLVMWSHGGGWDPAFSDHQISVGSKIPATPGVAPDPGMSYWWGVDETGDKSDKMDIDELATAIPDGSFEFIWFDCCYMGSVEVAYQLRRKSRYFVGYPTEVYTPGLDYTAAVPFLLKSEPDLKGAAKSLYDYYTYVWSTGAAVTVGVFDLTKFDAVVEIVRKAYADYSVPSLQGLIVYSRSGVSKLYDLRQTVTRVAEETGISLSDDEVNSVFDAFTVCKYASERNFAGQPIHSEIYSGLSTHIHTPGVETDAERFYRSLDWYDAVFPQGVNEKCSLKRN